MVSPTDYPQDLFIDCDRMNRDHLGIHYDEATAYLETRCHNALWALIKLTKTDFHGTEEIRDRLDSIQDELDACARELQKWPKRWRGQFWSQRTRFELRVNEHWKQRRGIVLIPPGLIPGRPGLPPPNMKAPATYRPAEEVARKLRESSASSAPESSRSAAQNAGIAARWRQRHALPEEGANIRPASQPRPIEIHATPVKQPNPLHQQADAMGAKQSREAAKAHAKMAERTRRQMDRERVNPDNARFGGIVNAFRLSEDPLSRPLQGEGKTITLVDDKNNPQHEFHLVHDQTDEYTKNLVSLLEQRLEHDRRTQLWVINPEETAFNAIEKNMIEHIAESEKAGGGIWVTGVNRLTIARVFLDIKNHRSGNWTLFGIGVGMSEGRFYILQTSLNQ